MEFNEYQEAAMQTAVYPGQGEFMGLAYAALGLNGEAGELAEKVKKSWRDGEMTPDLLAGAIKELGDTLWYAAATAEELGVNLDDVATINITKLQSRKDRDVLHGSGDER